MWSSPCDQTLRRRVGGPGVAAPRQARPPHGRRSSTARPSAAGSALEVVGREDLGIPPTGHGSWTQSIRLRADGFVPLLHGGAPRRRCSRTRAWTNAYWRSSNDHSFTAPARVSRSSSDQQGPATMHFRRSSSTAACSVFSSSAEYERGEVPLSADAAGIAEQRLSVCGRSRAGLKDGVVVREGIQRHRLRVAPASPRPAPLEQLRPRRARPTPDACERARRSRASRRGQSALCKRLEGTGSPHRLRPLLVGSRGPARSPATSGRTSSLDDLLVCEQTRHAEPVDASTRIRTRDTHWALTISPSARSATLALRKVPP